MKKKQSKRQPIYLRWRELRDANGNKVMALICADAAAQAQCLERGYKQNDLVRGDLTKPRDIIQHRRAHAIGTMALQIDGFTGTAHDALKRLQRETGVCCEPMEIDLGPLIGKVAIQVARSLSFDELDEGEFQGLCLAIYDRIAAEYWPHMTAAQVQQMADAMVMRY